MTIDAATNTARLSFSAGANHGYTLQFRDDLNPGPWTDLTNFPVLPAAATLFYSDPLPTGRTNRFYASLPGKVTLHERVISGSMPMGDAFKSLTCRDAEKVRIQYVRVDKQMNVNPTEK